MVFSRSTKEKKPQSELSKVLGSISKFCWRYILTVQFFLGSAALICAAIATVTWTSVGDHAKVAARAAQLRDASMQGARSVVFGIAAVVFLVLLVRSGMGHRADEN